MQRKALPTYGSIKHKLYEIRVHCEHPRAAKRWKKVFLYERRQIGVASSLQVGLSCFAMILRDSLITSDSF
jgi:hypothetical protein